MITQRLLTALCLTAALSACSSGTVRDTFGLDRAAPDEFRVVTRPPLSVPPQFNLQPPATANQAPSQTSTTKQAEALLTGNKPSNANNTDTFALKPETPMTTPVVPPVQVTGGNSAESAFLQNAGATKADPNVRNELQQHEEVIQETREDCSWWEIGCSTPDKKEPLVDAQKEKQRIRQDEKAGQPVTTGDTPEVKAKDTGLLGDIFGY